MSSSPSPASRPARACSISAAARAEPREIVGVDIAQTYLDFAAARTTDKRVRFVAGDGVALDLPDGGFDRALSLIALNFMLAPALRRDAARHARGRYRRGCGLRSAVCGLRSAVWDFPGGLVYQRVFWDTAAALDRTADAARARQYSSPLTHVGELEAAFRAAGLREVAARPLAIRMHYADFADYWQPIAHAQARSATT